MKKKLSIIIPIYNTEKYLEKCIRSVMRQSLKEIEIICVNDGSTDSSLKILENLSKEDDRLIIIDKKNGGSSSARNAALKIAKGEYCLNIDSDDWVEQDYFKEMYEKAKKDNLDILITDIIHDYGEKQIVIKDLKIENDEIINGKKYIELFFTVNGYGYTCNKLIKREVYEKNKIFYDENIFLLEDVKALVMLAYNCERIGKLNKAYYHYIQGENNGTTKMKVSRLYDILNSLNSLINFHQRKIEKQIVILIKEDKYIHILGRILYNKHHEKKEYNKFLKEFISDIKREKKLEFREERYQNKYSKRLILIFILLQKLPINMGVNLIKIFNFCILNKKIIKNI